MEKQEIFPDHNNTKVEINNKNGNKKIITSKVKYLS